MRPAVGMGAVAWLGLDYGAAIALLQVYGLCYPSIVDGVRLIEREALGVLNDASRKPD